MAGRGRPRKIRITKKNIEEARATMNIKANKKTTSPGPWTEIDPPLKVKARLRVTNGVMGEVYGTYPKKEHVSACEKGWYTVIFNVTSKSIMRDVEEYGLDNYLAACEKSLNSTENKEKYGTIVLLKATVDHSLHEDRSHRFISCYAKTNRKSIKGFLATRQNEYQVL